MKKKIIIWFLISILLLIFVFCVFNFILFPKKYKNYVVLYSEKYELDVALVYSIIKTESNFDQYAKSNAGAIGLMQIIPSTAKWVAKELDESYDEMALFEPETNIKYGCYFLKYLFEKFSSVDAVICAYNAGENAVKNWLDENNNIIEEKISFQETKNYLSKVKGYYNFYKNKYIIF